MIKEKTEIDFDEQKPGSNKTKKEGNFDGQNFDVPNPEVIKQKTEGNFDTLKAGSNEKKTRMIISTDRITVIVQNLKKV